jgi:hypothetical protein
MNWRDGLEGLIKGMDWSDGQRNGQIKGWRDVVLLYLFYFREKRNFRIFIKNPFLRKAKFSRFRGLFSRKTKRIFVCIFAKIYFRPNSSHGVSLCADSVDVESHSWSTQVTGTLTLRQLS